MIRLRFELRRLSDGCYSWRLVNFSESKNRVLVRAGKHYSSRKKALKAISKIQQAAAAAEVIDAGDTSPVELPAGSFSYHTEVMPLIFGQFPSRHDTYRKSGHRRSNAR